jgi:hypothetical protein
VHEPIDELLQVAAFKVLDWFFDAGGEFSKPLEIAGVTFERVFGKPALDAKMGQICVDELMGG